MKYAVKSAYYDHELKRTVQPDEVLDITKERAAVVNGAFPGTLEAQASPRKRTAKKGE